MPAKSTAQRRWAFGVKGAAWAKKHGMDNPGKLPARVKKKPTKPKPKKKTAPKHRGKKRRGR